MDDHEHHLVVRIRANTLAIEQFVQRQIATVAQVLIPVDILFVDVASVEVLFVYCHGVRSLASGAEEILQQLTAFVGEQAAHDFESMIKRPTFGQIDRATSGTRLGVIGTEDHPGYARLH